MEISETLDLLPWHRPYWEKLSVYIKAGRLPHGLMVTGVAGIGKMNLAYFLARSLVCEARKKNGEEPCGKCRSCHLMGVRNHPDFIFIEPNKPGNTILVDDIRELIGKLSITTHYGEYRVVILHQAHRLNTAAANSLLKTLEEPSKGTVIILVTEMPSMLPITVVSRCQKLNLPLPDSSLTLDWLREQGVSKNLETLYRMAGGAPFKALVLAKQESVETRNAFYKHLSQLMNNTSDPVSIAEKCVEIPEETIIEWLTLRLVDMIRISSAPDVKNLSNPDLRVTLQQYVQRLNLHHQFHYLDLLILAKQRLSAQANKKLLLEDLLIEYQLLMSNS